MTTTTPTAVLHHGTAHSYTHIVDKTIARVALSMLRFARNRDRRRALTHDQHALLRQNAQTHGERERAAERLHNLPHWF